MKQVYIVGTGTNADDSLTAEAKRAIDGAGALIGAERLLRPYLDTGRSCLSLIKAEDIADAVNKSEADMIAVLMSGDVGFYSGANSLLPLLSEHDVRLIPGISSVNAFFAKVKRTWQDAAFISLHGRNSDLVSAVRRNRKTFCITGGGIPDIARLLTEYGFGLLKVFVGENLGYPDERIEETTAERLINSERNSLCVLLIENEKFEAGISFGIDDNDFLRGDAPMTKSEVRAVTLSKLRLSPSDVCWDIGAGTGSVSVEMALSSYKGKVYAIEREEDAVPLIRQNAVKHKAANIEAIHGSAPEALLELPAPDAVFIGGSGGNLGEIFELILKKNKYARIVVNAVTLETLHVAGTAFKDAGIEAETVQISVSKARKLGKYNLLTAQNPVFIMSGQKERDNEH